MAVDKGTLDFWLEEGRKWLNAFNEFSIRQSIQLLIQQLDKVWEKGDYSLAWGFIQRLQDRTDEMQVLVLRKCLNDPWLESNVP